VELGREHVDHGEDAECRPGKGADGTGVCQETREPWAARTTRVIIVNRRGKTAWVTPQPADRFLTPRQAGRLVNVPRRSLYRAIANGELRACRLGASPRGQLRIRLSDLVAWLRPVSETGE
jgi:excisionase family DNA binding protein